MPKLKSLVLGLVCVAFVTAGFASAQTVSIVSGTGQATCTFFCGSSSFDPLVVVVKDAAGNPVANAIVNWQVTSGPGTINGGVQAQTLTDGNGKASVSFFQAGGTSIAFVAYVQSTVTATAGASVVTFYETTGLTSTTGASLLTPSLVSPPLGSILSGQSGSQGTTPIIIQVGAPNVALRLGPPPDFTGGGPTATCVSNNPSLPAGTVLSDAGGTASCTPVFSGGIGSGYVTAYVGNNYTSFGPYQVQVSAGLPCIMKVVNGNNQTGNPGQNLPAPLLASITDCGGAPLDAVPVTWGPVSPAGGATLFNQRTVSTNGQISTNVTLGSVGGAITIPVSVAAGTPTFNNQPVTATFTANVNLVITSFQKVGNGDNQEAAQNTAFANPLTVQVNNGANPVGGVTVNFAVASGSATVSSATAVTGSNGQASVTVTAGANAGPVVVTASIPGQNPLTFNLTVRPPGPTGVTFSNAAFRSSSALAPCSVAVATGNGLAPGVQGTVVGVFFGPWPLQLANLSIQFGNLSAPIYAISNSGGQQSATFQVPCETPVGNATVTVKAGSASANFTAQVQAVAPGIFENTSSDTRLRAVIVKPDGTFADLGNNYLRKGEIARMYVTGVGNLLVPAVGTNSPGFPDGDSTIPDLSNVVVGVNNAGVRVVSVRYARDLIGVYEVAFQVPSDVPAGDNIPLAIAINGVFGNSSLVAIQ